MTRTVIVVVEDDAMNRLLAVDALERAGFDVADFMGASDAVAFIELMPQRIAAVVSDVQIPGEQDGIDLVCAVRDRWPEIAVLVTSGRFGALGPDDLPSRLRFLPKPWTAKNLMAAVGELLRGAPQL